MSCYLCEFPLDQTVLTESTDFVILRCPKCYGLMAALVGHRPSTNEFIFQNMINELNIHASQRFGRAKYQILESHDCFGYAHLSVVAVPVNSMEKD